jgi:serine phosphatase RsbU (regulator of sigma subunit)
VPAIRDWLIGTFAGRALIIGIVIKSATLALAATGAPLTGALGVIDTIGGISLFVGASVLAYRLFVAAKRRLLWRVRRKLTLSYIFIGFVPALLIISFFLLSGLLLFLNIGSYMVRTRVAALADQAQFLAQSAEQEMQGAPGAAGEILARRHGAAAARYPFVSYAIVPGANECEGPRSAGGRPIAIDTATAGGWRHLTPPAEVPAWVPCSGYAGLVLFMDGSETRVAARGLAWVEGARPPRAVVVDVPLDSDVLDQLQAETGVAVGRLTAIADETPEAISGTPAQDTPVTIRMGPARVLLGDQPDQRFQWVAFLEHTRWDTGEAAPITAQIRVNLRNIYDRISGTPLQQIGSFNFGQILLILVAAVGGLFLIIQGVAFAMGLGLARSITGSVHELFAGTERVRQGDFTRKIPIRTRDQLGELADSFNSMTSSIEDLLQQKAEKERLEQELRIARDIQRSLLPQGPLSMPGLELAAHCEPAREVGGDYYDVLPIDAHRMGFLIADVAGKGTSAALYMAELKGVILALSQRYRSPRELLIDANRIISKHLNTRSFITITYAVVDLEARTLTHARAGHCPMLYLPGPNGPGRHSQVMMPDGLVLGLQIDNGEMFDNLLEEVTVPINAGDVFVLYTDGVTEAMNAAGDCFGDSRFSALIEEHGDLPFDQLRERILRDIRSFVGAEPQQDDMTMLLVRVAEMGVRV